VNREDPKENKLRRLAFSKITVLCLFAVLFTALIVSIVNDLYAFVKPEGEVLLAIEDPTELSELSQLLEQSGVVSNPTVFRLYVKNKNRTELLESFVGTLRLDTSMSYREILLAFSSS